MRYALEVYTLDKIEAPKNLLYSSFLFKNIKIKMYRTTILPVVLYGCETWSLTLREELG